MGIVQEIEIYDQMIYAITLIRPIETHKHLWDFVIQTDYLIPARRPDQVIIFTNPSARAGYDTRSFLSEV